MTVVVGEPAVSLGFALRDRMNAISEAPGKTWFWELADAVIDTGRCVQCGVCVAVCPSDSIGVSEDENIPELVKMCTGCSLCWDFCPRGGLRYEALDGSWNAGTSGGDGEAWKITGAPAADGSTGLGTVRRSYAARVNARIRGSQDGGVVSQILIAALNAGDIDGALVARASDVDVWKAEPFLARTEREIRSCTGSFYNQTMALGHLDLRKYELLAEDAIGENPRIAVVGTPCEIQGIRAMQRVPWSRGNSRVDSIVLTIALLCTKSFDYEGLMRRELRDKRGVDLDDIAKVDVIHGKMIVEGLDGSTLVSEPVKEFHGAALKGCDECADFLGRSADISVGSVGSTDGWSSVLVRSETGERALNRAWPALQLRELDNPDALRKLDALDKKVALRTLRREFDPDGPLFIDYAEHLANYRSAGAHEEHEEVSVP